MAKKKMSPGEACESAACSYTISGASSMGPREKVGMGSEGEGLRNLGFWATHRVVAQVMKLR